jgi:type VI secretion system VasD/TssJ family lipoprotein
MKKCLQWVVLFAVVVLISSCGSGQVNSEWRYEKQAVRLHLKSDSQLNLYRGSAHTLLLCVYYLRDPNAFNQLIEDQDGLSKLLECSRFDPSVASTKRVVVQPGDELTDSLDRAEGAKYVGLVAGYYFLQKEKVSRLYQIPVGGMISKKPEILNIDLYLAPQDIRGGIEK